MLFKGSREFPGNYDLVIVKASYLFYITCSACLTIMLVEIAIIRRVQTLFLYSVFFISLLPFKLFSFLIERLSQTVFRMFPTLLCLIVWGGGSTIVIKCKRGDFCDFPRQSVVKYTFWVVEMLGC